MVSQSQDPNCKDAVVRIGYANRPDGLSKLKKVFDNSGIHSDLAENKGIAGDANYYDLKVSWCKSDITDKIKDIIEYCTVPRNTPEARNIIAKGEHVMQVWEDGELTSTKGGKLYGKRTLHRISDPGKIKIIETDSEDDHQNRIVRPGCGEHIENLTNLLFYVGEINNRVKSLMKNK